MSLDLDSLKTIRDAGMALVGHTSGYECIEAGSGRTQSQQLQAVFDAIVRALAPPFPSTN
jgi:hypothetical protein